MADPPLRDTTTPSNETTTSIDPNDLPNQPKPPSPQLKAPLNYLYVISQFIILLSLLPYHAIIYSIFPQKRPRSSWTLLDSVFMPAVQRYLSMMDTAGFKISARDVFSDPGKLSLRNFASGCNFEWMEGRIDEDLRCGMIDDEWVKMRDKIGVFSWYRKNRRSGTETEKNLEFAKEEGELVGIFFHGGAFTHNSAHPKSQSTVMPMTIFNRDKRFISMHSVEFRLLPDYPFPAQLQDGVSVYINLLRRGVPAKHIVLMGDSSGANIALSLARWVRDTIQEGKGEERVTVKDGEQVSWRLADPGGLILFSPWVNPAHSFLNCEPKDYVKRTNECDYIFEEGPFRHHLVHNLLGHHPRNLVQSPYLSPGREGVPPHTFIDHPPCFISYGTGERGQAECERLVEYLRRDGTHVEVVRTEDTPHDILLLGFWKREQREEIWKGALNFLKGIPRGGDQSMSRV